MMPRRFGYLLWPAVIAGSFALGYYYAKSSLSSSSSLPPSVPDRNENSSESEMRLPSGKYIRTLLDCETGEYDENNLSKPLNFHIELKQFARSVEMREGISTVAVYFRDLDNGPWIGFNEKDRFTPASLYKIPIVIATLKEVIRKPEFLDMRMAFPGLPQPEMEQYHYPPAEIMEKGREYPVRELLQRTLRYSDNGAAWMLHEAVGQTAVDAVLKDMGINPEKLKTKQSTLSPEEFARFFRVLYNASYLPPPLSEAILSELAQNPFAEGLVAGLPKDVAVAHKHGEKMKIEENVSTIQLHDCGIVYHPKRPYLLSVMTKGNNYEAQAKVIADISKFVYEEVTRRTL